MHRRIGAAQDALLDTGGTARDPAPAQANLGLLDLLQDHLEAALPKLPAGAAVDGGVVDRTIASLWNVLVIDSAAGKDASPKASKKSAVAKVKALLDGKDAKRLERLLRQAGFFLVEAMRDADPRKLFDAYRKVASAFELTRGKLGQENLTLHGKRPGWFSDDPAQAPGGSNRPQRAVAMRRDAAAFLVAMADARDAMAPSSGADPARTETSRVMEQVFRAVLLREPFTVDAEAAIVMATSKNPADQHKLEALKAVYPTLKGLSARGLVEAPGFTTALRDPAAFNRAVSPPVLQGDWDKLAGTQGRFSHRALKRDRAPVSIEAQRVVMLLAKRWWASWQNEAPTTMPPCPPALVDAARRVLEAKSSANARSLADMELIEKATRNLAEGMWQADPVKISLSYNVILRLVRTTHPETYAVGTSIEPLDGVVPDAMLSGTDHGVVFDPDTPTLTDADILRGGASVSSATAFFLEAVQAVNQEIRVLASSGTIPADTAAPGIKGQRTHLIEEVLRSALTGHALKVNGDVIEALKRSSDPRDRARLDAFWKVYSEVRWLSTRGALAPPVILSRGKDGAVVSSIEDTLTDPTVRPSPPAIDDLKPWKLFALAAPEAHQSLDRAKGTLTLELTDERAPHVKTVRFDPWKEEDGPAAKLRQDDMIRLLEDFCVAHFEGTWSQPDNLVLEAERLIKAGRLTLATKSPTGWRIDRPAILEAASQFRALWATDVAELSTWAGPAKSLGAVQSTGVLEELRIVLQVEGDTAVGLGSQHLTYKSPRNTIWIQRHLKGESRVVHGASLVKLVGPTTSIKLMINGHRERVWNGGGKVTVGFLDAESLVQAATDTLRGLGIHKPVNRVVLVTCALESLSADTGFGAPFLSNAHAAGLVAPDATVTAYRHRVSLFSPVRKGRGTRAFIGDPRRHHAPDVTLVFQRDPVTGEIKIRDKYPSDPFGLHTAPIVSSGRGATGADASPQVVVPLPRESEKTLHGQAGRLHEAMSALAKTQAKAGFGPIDDKAPAAVVKGVRDKLTSYLEQHGSRDETTLAGASDDIADALWRQDPKKLYQAFSKLSRWANQDRPQPLFDTWDLKRSPIGFVSDVSLPTRIQESYYAMDLARSAAELALLNGVEGGLSAIEQAGLKTSIDQTRFCLGSTGFEFVKSVLSGRPFVVDVDMVDTLSTVATEKSTLLLRVLEAVQGAVHQLSDRGIGPAPIYMSDYAQDPADGWEVHPDGSDIHRGDALPELLPERRAQILAARKPEILDVDDRKPLRRLAAFMPDAVQTLDRKQGTIRIKWPDMPTGKQADSVLTFRADGDGPGKPSRQLQDADIRALDDLIVGEFFPWADSKQNSMPAQLALNEGKLTAGGVELAQRRDGRWVLDREAMREVKHILNPGRLQIDPPAPINAWKTDLIYQSELSELSNLAAAAASANGGGKEGSRLVLVLQMEDDQVMFKNAVRAVWDHPQEVVWVQVDRLGGYRIRHGENLLQGASVDRPLKLVINGHGSHDPATRSQLLSRSSPEQLVDHIKPVVDALGLQNKAAQVVLLSCETVTPFSTNDFGAIFLEKAIGKGLVRADARLTAYGQALVSGGVPGAKKLKRRTQRHPDASFEDHASGVTFQYAKDLASGKIIRTDKYPSHPGGSAEVVRDDGAAAKRQPGRAGKLFELFATLAETQSKSSIKMLTSEAPDAVADAVRNALKSFWSTLDGIQEGEVSLAAKTLADGVWQRDPRKIHDGYAKLSLLGAKHKTVKERVTWSDSPIGLFSQATLPSQLQWKYDKVVSMPLPDAALMLGIKTAAQAISGLPPAATLLDPLGGPYANQVHALVQATLSGRPFVIETDWVQEKALDAQGGSGAPLDVLEVAYATSMQLARRNVMAASLYLSEDRQRPAERWKRYRDGSLVLQGDLLPSLLPGRKSTLDRLRAPIALKVSDTAPLPRLHRFMPGAKQLLDRKAGTIRIVWPDLADGKQADSTLSFKGLDDKGGKRAHQAQDAAILAMDEFIVSEFFESAGPVRNDLPGELSFVDGKRLKAASAVLAERKDGRWVRDDAALREAVSVLRDWEWSPVEKPATTWAADAKPWHDEPLPTSAKNGARLLVILQMEDDPALRVGAVATIKKHPDEVVWIQVDREGGHVVRHGLNLLEQADRALPVRIEIEGHGHHDPVTRTQLLSGYSAKALADRVGAVIQGIALKSRAASLTLVSCATEAPVVAESFGSTFMKAAIEKHTIRADATMVAYGEVMFKQSGLLGTERIRLTERHPGATHLWHAPGVTWKFRKDPDTGAIVRSDKYPGAAIGDMGAVDDSDEDSPQRKLAAHRKYEHGASDRAAPDSLGWQRFPLNGVPVSAKFLATLGARIDGKPITGALLQSLADKPDDPSLRLKIDPEVFSDWASRLPAEADEATVDRLRDLGQWLADRKQADGADAAFTETPSKEARATVDRLIAASAPDGDGSSVTPATDAEVLTAARGDEADGTSLLGDILKDLTPSTRADFEGWMKRTGQTLDDMKGEVSSAKSHRAESAVEKVAREIERRAEASDGIDFDKILGVTSKNAVAALQELGLVTADSQGLRLDAARLKACIDKGGVRLAYAGRALRKLQGGTYRALFDAAPDSVRPFMSAMHDRPSLAMKLYAKFGTKLDGAINYADTVLGLFQIVRNWDHMSTAQKGLTVTQTASVVITPLTMMLGKAMSTLGPVARSGVLRAASAGLAGGWGGVAGSIAGLTALGMQWQSFNAEGKSLASPEGKLLIFNTVMGAVAGALSVASAVVGTAVVLAGGAMAVAGTALGTVSAMLGPIGLAAAVVMGICTAVTQAVLWFEEFGQYIHESTSLNERALAGFAKAFGFSTDLTLRAETEKAAREAAARLSQSLRGQLQGSLEFEAKLLAKQGYGIAMIPDTTHPVKHATYCDGNAEQGYNFALQPLETTATEFRKVVAEGPAPVRSGVAWLSMDMVDFSDFPRTSGNSPRRFFTNSVDRQLLQVGNLADVDIVGSLGDEVVRMGKANGVWVTMQQTIDPRRKELEIDAGGSDVEISFDPKDEKGVWMYGSRPMQVRFRGLRPNQVSPVDRLSLRNAKVAKVAGSWRDDWFDISAEDADISGAEGKNTYLLRGNNRITVTSKDVAIWTRGVTSVAIDLGHADAGLMLKVDVLHEALVLHRHWQHLDVRVGTDVLTLEHYFDRVEAAPAEAASLVAFVDAIGTVVRLSDPRAITEGQTGTWTFQPLTHPITSLDKQMVFDTALPDSRRTLIDDEAQNVVRLSSGGGDLRILPMTGRTMNVALDVPVERLSLLVEGDDLVIVEKAPDDAPKGFAPLRLRLPGQRSASAGTRFGGVTVWATDKDRTLVSLILPEAGKPVEGPVRVRAPDKAAKEAGATTTTPSDPAIAGQGADDRDDVIDARALPDKSVLRGGGGADTYRIKAGQNVVIDNAAQDTALDVLDVEGIDRHRLLNEVRFSRSGDDLVIDLAGGRVTLKGHAAHPHARHLVLRVAGTRFALPVVQGKLLVHQASSPEIQVLATAPGAHLVLLNPGEVWDLSKARRTVWMPKPGRLFRHGSSLEAVVEGDRASTVTLMDYHRAPGAWRPVENRPDADGSQAAFTEQTPFGGSAETAALRAALLDDKAALDAVFPSDVVRTYLEARGMPKSVASQIGTRDVRRLRRLHALLAVAVDAEDWTLPAPFIDAYAASDLTPSPNQGAMLRHLASRDLPWSYDERILRGSLSFEQLDAFEMWAGDHVEGQTGSDAHGAALDSFIQMMKGERPAKHFVPSLLAKVLELKGRPAAAAEELALVMVAADTMDETWAVGMLQAGVVHHDVLARLRSARVSPQGLALGNANRLRYEGAGDRSALIAVDTSLTFKSPVTTAFRYEVKYHIKFDAATRCYERVDLTPVPGVEYDLVPGTILDQNGEAPDPVVTYEAWRREVKEHSLEAKRLNYQWLGFEKIGKLFGLGPYKSAPLSSPVRMWLNNLVRVIPSVVEGAWDGRSTPANLVDGFKGHGEVEAWRPGSATASSGQSKPNITLDAGKFIQFDFAHPVALRGLKVHLASAPSSPKESTSGTDLPGWTVQAQQADDRWIEVAPGSRPHRGFQDGSGYWHIDTKGVPYHRYRLAGLDGRFQKEAWFSEVEFETEEAGTPHRDLADSLRRAGFSDQEVKSLFLHGLRDEGHVRRAIDLRKHFGSLPPAVVVEDVLAHERLQSHGIEILTNVKANVDDRQPWSPEALLRAVRLRIADRHAKQLNDRLPFLDPASIESGEPRVVADKIKRRLEELSSRTPELSVGGPPVAIVLPGWLKGMVDLSTPQGDGLRFTLGFGAVSKGTGAQPSEATEQVNVDRLKEFVDTLHAELAKRLGETQAKSITAPWYLHVAALAAAFSGQSLHLQAGSKASADDATLHSLIENSLPRLQAMQTEGLLRVQLIAPLPPVGEKTAWRLTGDPDPLYVSPGVDLPAEYGEAKAGHPVARLSAHGFTAQEAKDMVARGVRTLEQITRAIETRQQFKGLAWKLIADDAIYGQPPSDALPKANEFETLRFLLDRSRDAPAVVVGRLPPALRAQMLVGLLPAGGHASLKLPLIQHLVKKVRSWLPRTVNAKGKRVHTPEVAAAAIAVVQAVSGQPAALQRAIAVAGVAKWSPSGKAAAAKAKPWAPPLLEGYVSLAPAEAGAKGQSGNTSLDLILETHELLLEELAGFLRGQGLGEEVEAEALRPLWLDLAVLRAALSGQQLLLHVPPVESPQEKTFMATVEKRLAGLQEARLLHLLEVKVASSMPAYALDEPWVETSIGGKTWYLLSRPSLDAAWNESKDSQAISRLKKAGFGAADARSLYDLGVKTEALVKRAIDLVLHLGPLSPDVIASDVVKPPLSSEDLWEARTLVRVVAPDAVALLKALRDRRFVALREARVNSPEVLPTPRIDLIRRLEADPSTTDKGVVADELKSSLTGELRRSLSAAGGVDDGLVDRIAASLVRALTGGQPLESDEGPLREALCEAQWAFSGLSQSPQPIDAAWTPPESLRGFVSLVTVNDVPPRIAASTAIVLDAFERLLRTVDARLDARGAKTDEETRAIDTHFLRLAATRAVASGQQLLLHVPPTGTPKGRRFKALIDLEAQFRLEMARRGGDLDISVATSRLPVVRSEAWSDRQVSGETVYTTPHMTLFMAWEDALRSFPFHRLTSAGYTEDEALALLEGGIDTLERADRAVELRAMFGPLTRDVVLREVVDRAPFSPAERKLAAVLGPWEWRYDFDAPSLVRASASDPVVRVAPALAAIHAHTDWNDEVGRLLEDVLSRWLSESQGEALSSMGSSGVSAFKEAMRQVVNGDVRQLASALVIARGLGFKHRGASTVRDPGGWLPATLERYAALLPAVDGSEPAMAASDYVVLEGFKRLLDAVRAWRGQGGSHEHDVASAIDPLYLPLQLLRAAATSQHVEFREVAGEPHEDAHVKAMVERLRFHLHPDGGEPVIKFSFRPVDGGTTPADPPGGRARRHAMLLMQEMAHDRSTGEGMSPSSGTHPAVKPMTLLTAAPV